MPYLGMDNVRELSFGDATVWNIESASDRITSDAVRTKVKLLLGLYRRASHNPAKAAPLSGVGVLTTGPADQRPLTTRDWAELHRLQRVLFLCCLAHNVRLHGPNAGHSIFTAENFDIVRQTFTLDNEYISEQIGTIVSMTLMGYKLDETVFATPADVPRPLRFACDDDLLRELRRLRRTDPLLLRRILDATEVFRSSYYNSRSLGIPARVLLQAAAFEVLLDLPDKDQRRTFKDAVERLLNSHAERRFAYKYQVHASRKTEVRSVKGIWADRFYTLRNHLIHGETILPGEFTFRAAQHHLVVAPMVFVVAVKGLIDESRAARRQPPVSDVKLAWHLPPAGGAPHEDGDVGFRVDTDYRPLLRRAQGRRRRR